MYIFPNEYNEICVPAGAREEFLEKEVADLKEELSRKTEMLCAMEAELRKVSEGQMEWISVEERLPESEFVLCTDGKYCFVNIIPDMEDVLEDGVTHWMPLPEPPKEGINASQD